MMKENRESTVCSPSSAVLRHSHLVVGLMVVCVAWRQHSWPSCTCWYSHFQQCDCGQFWVIDSWWESQTNQFSFCDQWGFQTETSWGICMYMAYLGIDLGKWEAVTSRQCFRLSMHGLSYIVLLRSAPPLRLLLIRGVSSSCDESRNRTRSLWIHLRFKLLLGFLGVRKFRSAMVIPTWQM